MYYKGMQLKHFLTLHGISGQKFADSIGVKQPTVWRWINGTAIPRAQHMASIAKVTRGEVTPETFFQPIPDTEDTPIDDGESAAPVDDLEYIPDDSQISQEETNHYDQRYS